MSAGNKNRLYSEDQQAIKDIADKFLHVNNARLKIVRDTLKTKQRLLIDVLPLLFHYNEFMLPGYVGDDCPIGIFDYSPTDVSTKAAKSLAKEYSARRVPMRTYNIFGLYLIGSAGTIAYTDRSDLDIWVCHRPDLNDDDVFSLINKCEKIKEWAGSLELQVNFFVLTPDSIREGRIEALSEESSGSAQHLLLLEEFYRSGLLLAGRIPAWWLVPPDKETEYQDCLNSLLDNNLISEHDIIDFGDVSSIPAAEFYGAALWQLNKAIDSPYKSMLKLLLMEAYASEYPNNQLLCTRLKQAIYEGETNIDKLDSYVLMISKLDEYLSRQGHTERLNLARRCFYFKVHEWLTDRTNRSESRTREVMQELTQQWEWTRDELLILDTRESWKIDRVLEERSILVSELTQSYRFLSDFARKHTNEANISQNDLNILGRRLYTAFERKSGKIDLVNPGISVNLSERRLTIVHTRVNETQAWLLFRGEYQVTRDQKQVPIKRTQSLLELIAWCHFNGLLATDTMINLQSFHDSYTSQELLQIIDTFRTLFPDKTLPRTGLHQLSESASVLNAVIFINLGTDPLASHTRKGLHLTSNRADALSYGGKWQNLVQRCDVVIHSSWGEILTYHYDGEFSLVDCVTDYLAWTPVSSNRIPVPITAYSFASSYGTSISRRVEKLFTDLIQYFYKGKGKDNGRYILRIERKYALLQNENEVPRYSIVANDQELLMALRETQSHFSPYYLDRYAHDHRLLHALQNFNFPDVIQLFYLANENTARVYVLDENGSLYYQEIGFFDIGTMLGHFKQFFESAIKRRKMLKTSEMLPDTGFQFEFYQLRKSSNGALHVDIKDRPKASDQKNYFDLQVIGDALNPDHGNYSIYCNNIEFSTLEYGANVLQETVSYILGKRKKNERYPIYITDIDIMGTSKSGNTNRPLQTIELLNYKKQIEDRLNGILQKL